MERLSSTPECLSHSRAKTALHCQRQYYYSYLLRLRPKEDAFKLWCGSLMHEAREIYHKEQSLEQAQAHTAAEWGDAKPQFDIDLRILHAANANYDRWHHKRNDWQIVQVFDKSQIARVADLEFIITPDMIVETDAGLAVVDYKFTFSYLGKPLIGRIRAEKQMRLYCLGASENYGEPIHRAIVDATFLGKQHCAAATKATLFDRYVFDYHPAELYETHGWLRHARRETLRMEASKEEKEELFVQNAGYHCNNCDFEELCSSLPAQRKLRINKYRRK